MEAIGTLTSEQARVVEAPIASRLLVIAGPGTGKTHTLVARAASLADPTKHSAAASVLALSFTRSVVSEIQNRTRDLSASPVSAATIHAYAWKLLAQHGEATGFGFDRTVTKAAKLVRDGEVTVHFEHILVDEAQDLVGGVGDFIRALLAATDGGFTVFGDPDQAIFDFNAKAGESNFFSHLRQIGGLTEVELTQNFRADPNLGEPPSPNSPELVQRHLRELNHLTSPAQLATLMKRRNGSLVLLTCTNGEGLQWARDLQELGISSLSMRQSVTLSAAPPWIARFVNSESATRWTRDSFLDWAKASASIPDPVAAWREVRQLTRGIDNDNAVTQAGIRTALATPRRADDGIASAAGPTVSTIHRAKGLEWDDVVVLEPRDPITTETEARQLYVAMTRSRGETIVLSRGKIDFKMHRLKRASRRWAASSWSGKLLAVECQFGDVNSLVPPSGSGDAAAIQGILGSRIVANDPVELIVEDRETITVTADGETIGYMSKAFADELNQETTLSSITKLIGARVLCVRSTSGDPDECELAGLPATGVWLCAEIYGLASLKGVA